MAGARDLATSGAVALFAALYLSLGRGLEPGLVNGVPGPGSFPRLLGLAMLACAAYLAGRGVVAVRQARAAGAGPPAALPRRLGRVAAFYGLFVLYVLALPVAGFASATFVFAALSMSGLLGLGRWQGLGYAAGLTLLAYGLFRVLLDVPLPAGWLV